MVTWEGFALHNNLVPLLGRAIEAPEQDMYIPRQRPHGSHLTRACSHNGRHKRRPCLVDIDKRWNQLVLMVCIMANYTFGSPGPKIILYILPSLAGL